MLDYLSGKYDDELVFTLEKGYDREIVKEKGYSDILETEDENAIKVAVDLAKRGLSTQPKCSRVNLTANAEKAGKKFVIGVRR